MTLRPIEPADRDALAAFEAAHAGAALISDPLLFERVYRSPWSKGFAGMIAEERPGVIGALLLVVTVPGIFAGEAVPLSWPAVLFASPEGRARGLGGRLMLWAFRSQDLAPSMNGTAEANSMKDLIARSSPGLIQHRHVIVHAPEAALLCPPDMAESVCAQHFAPAVDAGTWRWSDGLPVDYPDLWSAVRPAFALAVDRDESYMAWRYREFPYLDYRFLEVRHQDCLVASAVVRFQDTGEGRVARIVDFVAQPGESAPAWAALAQANAAAGAVFSDFFVVGTAYRQDLQMAGFADCNLHPHLWGLPNLLSPVDHRHWIPSFHLGGRLVGASECWKNSDRVYFTKGDCDRDFPTRHTLAGR